MAIIHVNESTGGLPNSGRLSGTDGDLVGIMDVALPLNGWAIEYTSGNARVYRPGTGNRFRLHMNDAAAASGAANRVVVRGCENASNATTLTDPFPTVAIQADSLANWIKSSTVNTTARAFDIYVGETWVWFWVNPTGATNSWEGHFFGDCPSAYAGDSYNTLCTTRNTTATGVTFFNNSTTGATGNAKLYWCRSYDGTVKGTQSSINFYTTTLGVVTSFPTVFSGPSSSLDTQKLSLCDTGSTGTTPDSSKGIPVRGYLPNMRAALHAGRQLTTPNSRDDYTDTAYDAAFTGIVYCFTNNAGGGVLVAESSDTWAPPSG